jgi:hypothetical protein
MGIRKAQISAKLNSFQQAGGISLKQECSENTRLVARSVNRLGAVVCFV